LNKFLSFATFNRLLGIGSDAVIVILNVTTRVLLNLFWKESCKFKTTVH